MEQAVHLTEDDRRAQFVARSLGDGKTLDRARYERAFGRPFDQDYGDVLARLAAADLVDDDGAVLALSDLGKLAYDIAALAFYPKHVRDWLAAARASVLRPEPAVPAP